MAFLETKHTISRINKIKKDLNKTISTLSVISMIVFLTYYLYLFFLNLNNLFYLVIYSSLIIFVMLLFIVEFSLKENKKILKKEKRIVIEKKRKIKAVIKSFNYIFKAVLLVIAIYETINNFNLMLPNIVNICSAIFLLIQILFEIIANYTIKQIDYFRLSTELDLNDSSIVINKIIDIINPIKSLQDAAIKSRGENIYTIQEQQMIKEIKIEANKYIKEKEEQENLLRQMAPEPSSKIQSIIDMLKK